MKRFELFFSNENIKKTQKLHFNFELQIEFLIPSSLNIHEAPDESSLISITKSLRESTKDARYPRIGSPIVSFPVVFSRRRRRRRRRRTQRIRREDQLQHPQLSDRTLQQDASWSPRSAEKGGSPGDSVEKRGVNRLRRFREGLHGDEPRFRRASRD